MTSKSKMKQKPCKGIPVVVCEFHQEVIQYIHRYIAKKKLPFTGIKMIHFDSHPDLAFPRNLNAEDCFDKEILYNDLDIADWILPLMYEGHVKDLIWMKPPWASQMENLKTTFNVGKCKDKGSLKVTCTEDYFIEDCIYSPKHKLEKTREVNLQVSTFEDLMKELNQNNTSAKENDTKVNTGNNVNHTKQSQFCNGKNTCTIAGNKGVSVVVDDKKEDVDRSKDTDEESDTDCCKRMKLDTNYCSEKCDAIFLPLENEKYILDIDLDFFSVMNPFLQDYSQMEYSKLKEIYRLDLPTDKSDEDELERFVTKLQSKIDNLQQTITVFARGESVDDSSKNEELIEFLKIFKENRTGNKIDWELVHSAGLTTELPHHVSSDDEIEELIGEMKKLVCRLPPPTLITIARSAVDEYCPPDQVDKIEERVVDMLREMYKDIDVHYDYKDTSRLY